MDIVKYLQAFIEGMALIVSPCILPVLPLILTSSVEGGKQRPYGVIIGFILAFCLVALFSRQLVTSLGIDIEWLQWISYALLFLFGLILLSTRLSEWFSDLTQRFSDWGSRLSTKGTRNNDFWGGLFLGACIGLIWTPCAGPILATVIVQIILQKSDIQSGIILFTFALGVGAPMLLIATGGQKMIQSLGFFRQHSLAVRRTLGVIILLTVVFGIQQGLILPSVNPEGASSVSAKLVDALPAPYQSPEIKGIDAWINSGPLTIKSLKGKVVLIDFWTYSCINCIRTFPYLKSWYNKYHDKGLVIIGVHSPEFSFERKLANVQNAVKRNGLLYPVALDNNLQTWLSFQNNSWPAHYLIDKQGRVVYVHLGEGDYDVTEQNIRYLLGVSGPSSKAHLNTKQGDYGVGQTPETYLGKERAENFNSPQTLKTGQFTFPDFLSVHAWALRGAWKIEPEKIVSGGAGSKLRLNFYARKVFLVMGTSSGKPVKAKLFLNGKPLLQGHGEDVHNGELLVKQHTLYELVGLSKRENAQLDIQAESPGLEAYAFTFSS